MTATADAQGPVPMPVFLLWSQSLHLPFHYQLPLDCVEGRDKLALPAGGQDKSPPVTPLEWHLGSQAPGPLPLGKTRRGSSLGRQGLGQGSLGQKKEEIKKVCALHGGGLEPLVESGGWGWDGGEVGVEGWVKVIYSRAQKQHLKPQGWCHTPTVH